MTDDAQESPSASAASAYSSFARGRRDDEREALLAALFDNGVVGIAEVDIATGRFVNVSRRFCEIERRSRAKLLTLGPQDVIPPEDFDAFVARRDAALAKDGAWHGEVRHRLGDGEIAWVQLSISVSRRDAAGAPLRIVALVKDVTERVEALEKIRLNEEIMRVGQTAGRIATFVRDLRTNTVVCSGDFRAMVGLPPGDDELPPDVWTQAVVPEDRASMMALVTAAVANREREIAYNFRIRRQDDGQIRHFEMRTRYFYAPDGAPLRAISVAIDVTEMARAAEKLRFSEEMRRLAQEAGKMATFDTDIASGEVTVTPESRALMGLPGGDVKVTFRDWMKLLVPEDRERLTAARTAAVNNREDTLKIKYRLLPQDGGEMRFIEMRSRFFYDEHGKPLRTVGVSIDVTELEHAAERLRISEEMLRLGQKVGRIATFERNLTTGVVTANAESRAIMGLPQSEGAMPTEVWTSVIAEQDRPRIAATMAAAAANHEAEIAYQFRVQRPGEPEVRHFEMRARYFYDEQGRPERSLGVAIDVTENVRAAEKLRFSEEMLRLGQQVGQIAAFTHDYVNQSVIINDESRVLLGLPTDERPLTSQEWFSLVVREDRERVAAEVERVKENQEDTFASEHRMRRRSDGATRWVYLRARYFYDADGRPLRAIGVCIDITERRMAEQKIAHAARHDALTGLPNRVVLRERLADAVARGVRGEDFAVLCLDLDRFKDVNDTMGHAVGDRLLIEATARIGAALRKTDTLARLGGDEFVVVLAKISAADAAMVAQRIVTAVSEPYSLEGQRAVIGVSIGIARGPEDGESGDDLLRAADLALYQAKADGRGRYAFYTPDMNERMQSRRALHVDLQEALDRGEFELFYQPIVAVASGALSGFEALIRWRRADGELVPPNDFIPLCEETGLIVPLGAWVIATACAEAARWGDELTVAVNLSPLQLSSGRLESDVASALKASGLAPSRLELEITESAVLRETDATLELLARLKGQGIRIAMDDFGAGYSSLSNLQRFPFDRVKIDRAFTRELASSRKSQAIVQALSGLCEALEMSTTVEGVETQEQLRAVVQIGCQNVQGYLFSRPRPACDIPAMRAQFATPAAATVAAE